MSNSPAYCALVKLTLHYKY